MTLSEALQHFYIYLETVNRSPETIRTYKGHLSSFESYLIQKYNNCAYIGEVKQDDFEKYLYESPNDKKFTQVTRQGITTAFKSFYSFCYKKGYSKTDIGKKAAYIYAKPKERTYITEDELLKIVGELKGETDKVMLQTMFYTGLRISEAISLTFEDVNFMDNYIYVKKHKSIDDRKIPISVKLGYILEEYIENCRNEIQTDSDKVFVLENGQTCNKSRFNWTLKQAAKKAGLKENISSHIMRHSFASNLIAKGVDIVKVQKLLGHNSIRTTSIYLHTNMQALKKAVSTL